MKNVGLKDARLLEALEYVDTCHLAEVIHEFKLPVSPQATAEQNPKKGAIRSLKYIAALAACLLLLGGLIPAIRYAAERFSTVPPVGIVGAESSDELPELTHEITEDGALDVMSVETDIDDGLDTESKLKALKDAAKKLVADNGSFSLKYEKPEPYTGRYYAVHRYLFMIIARLENTSVRESLMSRYSSMYENDEGFVFDKDELEPDGVENLIFFALLCQKYPENIGYWDHFYTDSFNRNYYPVLVVSFEYQEYGYNDIYDYIFDITYEPVKPENTHYVPAELNDKTCFIYFSGYGADDGKIQKYGDLVNKYVGNETLEVMNVEIDIDEDLSAYDKLMKLAQEAKKLTAEYDSFRIVFESDRSLSGWSYVLEYYCVRMNCLSTEIPENYDPETDILPPRFDLYGSDRIELAFEKSEFATEEIEGLIFLALLCNKYPDNIGYADYKYDNYYNNRLFIPFLYVSFDFEDKGYKTIYEYIDATFQDLELTKSRCIVDFSGNGIKIRYGGVNLPV